MQIDSTKYLDLNKFWQISQDSNSAVPEKTRNKALACLIEILEKFQGEKPLPGQMTKLDFLNLARENI